MQFVLTVVSLLLEAISEHKSGDAPLRPAPARALPISSIFIFLPEVLLPFPGTGGG